MVVEHGKRAHALLGASSSKMWLNCPPSARLADRFPQQESEYAKEGTTAHEYAELLIRKYFDLDRPEVFTETLHRIKNSKYYDKEFEYHVMNYVNYVINLFVSAKNTDPVAVCLTEQEVDFSEYVPEGFGTLDLAIYTCGKLLIGDLKFGKGVRVEAENNTQLMIYAIGFILKYVIPNGLPLDSVTLLIHQPRLENVSMWTVNPRELFEWATTELYQKAQLAWRGEGEFKTGEHCKFCNAVLNCPARINNFNSFADLKYDTRDDFTIPQAVIDRVLSQGDEIVSFISKVKSYVLDRAINGNPPQGYKVVRSNGRRSFTSKPEVANMLLQAGFKRDQIFKEELMPLTYIEELLGKKNFLVLSNYVEKSEGNPTLVKESDGRQSISNASAFIKYE